MNENVKKNAKRNHRIRNLVLICVMTALLLTVGTYAWFIGMQTVKVNEFSIDIAGVDSLMLSMDGKTWSTTITADQATAYEGNTNNFMNQTVNGKKQGLKPISTVGKFNTTASRLELFEKGSLTATEGGYRLLASRVNNYDEDNSENPTPYTDADGYVVFDLFVMNLSGDAYYDEASDPSNEEAIYLTYDSKVINGGTGNDAGIQNSVRVAFGQIGRVEASKYYPLGETEADKTKLQTLTGMTCTTKKDEDGNIVYTGICNDAVIWEPNDMAHVEAAKTWYETTCNARKNLTGGQTDKIFEYIKDDEDTTDVDESDCASLATYYATNAVQKEILVTDYVDVYDGPYNKYTGSDNSLLKQVTTFTDTNKAVTGTDRKEFMTLAPNSITKIRVYIWIEGQDIDNFDFASLGNSIKVAFGFTKERITTGEIDSNINPDNGPKGEIDEEQLPKTDIAYEATGEVKNISSSNVTYDSENNKFVYDRKNYLTEFTFDDGSTLMKATYSGGSWSVTEVE